MRRATSTGIEEVEAALAEELEGRSAVLAVAKRNNGSWPLGSMRSSEGSLLCMMDSKRAAPGIPPEVSLPPPDPPPSWAENEANVASEEGGCCPIVSELAEVIDLAALATEVVAAIVATPRPSRTLPTWR